MTVEVALGFHSLREWETLAGTPAHRDAVDLDVDASGRVYVLTREAPAVLVYERDGRFVTSWGSDVLSPRPHGITIAPDGRVFVVDEGSHCVRVFSDAGDQISLIGTCGVPSGTGFDWNEPRMSFRDVQATVARGAEPFNHPTKLAIAADGDLYVSDGYGNARVHRFSREGVLRGSWGSPGPAPGQFRVPHSIAIGADGRVFVCDRENERIQIFDRDGAFLEQWTDVQRPAALAFDREGRVFVAELAWFAGEYSWRRGTLERDEHARLSVLDRDGTVLTRFGGPSSEMTFDAPHGLAFDTNGDLYVSEIVGNLIDAGRQSASERTVQKLVREGHSVPTHEERA